MRGLMLVLVALSLSGCATRAVQTETLLADRSSRPAHAETTSVPFENQTAGHCGPATLAMVLRWAGKPVSVDEISKQVYTPGAKGSFQADMISASRRQGMMAVPIEGMPALLDEVAAGHPVIVFENLALSWLPRWHYAVVYGYDLDRREALMHSGPEKDKRWDLEKLERSWMLADYWGLVVLPPGQLAASAGELEQANAAAGLEQAGHPHEAELAYRALLLRWPGDLTALMGLGNVTYARGEFRESVRSLREAVRAHPDSAMAWHNLALAEAEAKLPREASASAARAMKLVANDSREAYREDLRELL